MSRPPGSSRARTLVLNAALCLVAFGLLGWAVWSNREQVRAVLSRPIDVGLFSLAFVIYMTALVLTFGRWFVLVRALGLPFRPRDALRLGFIGNTFNLVLPGGVGGDVIKAAFLCREQAKRTQAVASMVIDRALGLLGLFVLAGASGAAVWGTAGPDVRKLIAFVWAAAVSGLIGLAVIFTPSLYRPLQHLVRGRGRLESFLEELVSMAGAYRRRLGTVAAMLLLAIGTHALFVLVFYTASRAIFPSGLPTLGRHFLIAPLCLFTTAIPVPFGALGVSETISGELFKLVDHPGGAVAMMAFRVVMYAAGVVSLLVYLANARQVRELSDDTGPNGR